MPGELPPGKDSHKELEYYKKQLDQLSGESIRHDFILSSLRYEVKQKKEAFDILTTLQNEFSVAVPLEIIFTQTVKAINMQLRMDRSVVLLPSDSADVYTVGFKHGFTGEEISLLQNVKIKLRPDLLNQGQYILLNKSMQPDEQCSLIQQSLFMNFFVGVPVLVDDDPIAFIISGRQFERKPFAAALDKGDVDTLGAIAGLIRTLLQNRKIIELKSQKAEVEKQNKQIAAQRDQLEQALADLRNAQAQLIQSEKMASLGELTAGVAHEIQNPLNFVNNFSQVNEELIKELEDEASNGNLDEVRAIVNHIATNSERINHHGKRAEAIVKSMLQHSRISSGQKELTDISVLADEYVRLAYHGFRAKDKSFNAKVQTDLDPSVGKINVVPQDIGRVVLNVINNAFYAVNERQRVEGQGYEPTVIISTTKQNGKVEIKVRDNGNGIPQNILGKIFQPFFTTKPTGQGTGLGLSLSYDIVKAHGGEIKIETKEGEGSEFVIQLPLS